MRQPFDAGHEQLVSAACSGLRSAFRGAAERSAQLSPSARRSSVAANAPVRSRSGASPLWAAVATFLLGLHISPVGVHPRHLAGHEAGHETEHADGRADEADRGVHRSSAADAGGD